MDANTLDATNKVYIEQYFIKVLKFHRDKDKMFVSLSLQERQTANKTEVLMKLLWRIQFIGTKLLGGTTPN